MCVLEVEEFLIGAGAADLAVIFNLCFIWKLFEKSLKYVTAT